MEKINLYCIPYAGGIADSYLSWSKFIDDNIQIVPVELSGRGSRFKGPLYKEMDSLIDDVYSRFKNKINDGRYMIYGHSMGALIAYELIRRIQKNGDNKPLHVFFSGSLPPNIKEEITSIYKLEDKEFMKSIFELGGTPHELLEEPELLEIFVPILRADYELLYKYNYSDDKEKIKNPVSILYGKEDTITMNRIKEWDKCVCDKCEYYEFDGGHFFINTEQKKICQIIYEKYKRYVE